MLSRKLWTACAVLGLIAVSLAHADILPLSPYGGGGGPAKGQPGNPVRMTADVGMIQNVPLTLDPPNPLDNQPRYSGSVTNSIGVTYTVGFMPSWVDPVNGGAPKDLVAVTATFPTVPPATVTYSFYYAGPVRPIDDNGVATYSCPDVSGFQNVKPNILVVMGPPPYAG